MENKLDKYEEMLSRYNTDLDDAQVAAAVEKIVRDNLVANSTPDVYKFLFHCIDLRGSVSRFSFTADEERRAVCPFASSLRTYLYEPNASLLKAGAFRLPAERAGLEKLHPNSHLYTSDAFLPGFPGRVFAIEGVCGFGKRELKALTADLEQANLTVRNFPATVAELRKRLRLREGGSTYLFATTLADGRKVLLKCIKAPNSSPETCDE